MLAIPFPRAQRYAQLSLLVASALSSSAWGLPTGVEVAAGHALLTQPNAQTLHVNQSTSKAILNWQQFNVQANEKVQFLQPSSSAVALNRVVGNDPSAILGQLSANGRVFLVNPNGVLFGAGSRVDVGGLVASALNIADRDFLDGRYHFTDGGVAGSVINRGQITAQEQGYVALLGSQVANEGIVQARLGTVALAAGDRITLDMAGDRLINLAVDQATYDATVSNKQLIQAHGGTVIMSAKAAHALASSVVNNEGVIEAHSLVERGGVIRLEARSAGAVSNAGTIDVSAAERNAIPGSVSLSAQRVLVEGSISADAGARGAASGSITLKAAEGVTLASGSRVSASGAKGGSIVIESGAGLTQLAGTIAATGNAGMSGNDGGAVMVKADALINTGLTDASGAAGGAVTIETNRYLGAGALKASGTAGAGGSVSILAREYLIQTTGESLAADGGGAGQGGSVTVQAGERVFSSARISAQGAGDGQRGGEVRLLADEVMLYGASINASGEGGGTVLIGGDYQGGNPAIPNASRTWINYSSVINANATELGNGGKVIIWSEHDTRYAGHVSARGGTQSGAGGLIEVSGKDSLVFGGTADAGAANGAPGRLLLDPKNIIIDSAAGGLSSFQLVDPSPGAGNSFGASTSVTVLSNDNVVVANPLDDFGAANAGAVHLFNGTTGALVSTLTGSQASDGVGGAVTVLGNGHYVVRSSTWDNGAVLNAGAVTWGSGTTGIVGAVSAANSLVGTTAGDQVGSAGVTALSNGNYVVRSTSWDNGAVADAGAVTWGSGTTGIVGAVSAANSLVGTTASDQVGSAGVTALSNGNYVVGSQLWDNGAVTNAGAVTWGGGTTGVSGAVSAANSLVGTTASDSVGNGGVTPLSTGNYVVRSVFWANGAATWAGAVTFGNGTTGVSGAVSAANSLVGTTLSSLVGGSGITALANGNYVVNSDFWKNGPFLAGAGAVTFGNGTTGVSGAVSAANSLVGTKFGDRVGLGGVTALSNSNYVVASPNWGNGALSTAGAVTWGSGTTGVVGAVSAANSLIGTTASDQVGSTITALTNSNYVVRSPLWNNGAVADAGAVTWGNGTTGVVGAVSAANSLVGTTANDQVGSTITALTNSNYVVRSPLWNNGAVTDAGAVTWGSGTTGIVGAVSAANSLVGTTANDQVGSTIRALTNGNYVVTSTAWDNGAVLNAGAVTWGSGTTGIVGAVSAANSLVGTTANDQVGSTITALTNGNYVVTSTAWDNGAVLNAGAVTFGSGTTGVVGAVSAANSLIGTTASDAVGGSGITALTNGNYVVTSTLWDNGAVANAGAVTFGSGTTGVVGAVSAANSLVGTTASDQVGSTGVTALSNGNYVVRSTLWDNGAVADVGAVTFGSATTGVVGAISAVNSLVGTTASDQLGSGGVTTLSTGNFVVKSPLADSGALVDAGLVHVVLAPGGALSNPLAFSDDPSNSVTITPAQITAITNAGTAVVLQANNDITLAVSSDITTSAGGAGGALTMQAGRSILVNSNITTDNGALTLTANETTANGVVDANRDAGAAVITMAAGTTLNAGNGNITLNLSTGAGLTNNASGSITLENLTTSGHVWVANNGATAGSGIARASSNSLISAASAAFDVSGAGGGGAIGDAANPIRVNLTNLEARSQSGGAIFNSPTQGLAIGGANLGGLSGVWTSSNGPISVTAAGTLTATEAVSANGNGAVTLAVSGATSDITSSTTIGSGSGLITLQAPDAVTLTAGATVGAGTTGAITIDADSDASAVGTLTTSAAIGNPAAAGAITLSAATLALGASVTGSGALLIQPSTAARTIGIGTGAGLFSLSAAEVAFLTNGFSGITIGRSNGTGTLTSTAITFNDPVTWRVPSGTITLGDVLTGAGNTSVNLTAATVNNPSITTTNNPIAITASNGGILMTSVALSAGTGDITLTGTGSVAGSYGIHLNSAATITTTSGNINLTAYGTGTSPGTRIANAGTLIGTATGAINITGTGGPAAAGISSYGIHLDSGAIIESTSNSTISLTGTGGTGTIANHGIRNQGGTLSAVDGAISLIGFGHGSGVDGSGIVINSGGVVQATGNATVSLTGAGSATGTDIGYGVRVSRGGIVSVADGALTLTGTGGGSGTGNIGVSVDLASAQSGLIRSTGSGTVTIVGVGGNGTDDNAGIRVGGGSSKVTAVNGAIHLTGTGGGSGTGNHGITLQPGGQVESSGAASLTLSGTGASGAYGITGTGGVLTTLAGGNATLATTASALDLPTTAVSGSLDVVADGAITQGGVLTIVGATTLAAGAANDITLTSASNDLSSLAITSGRNVAYNDANGVVLGASTVLGSLDVTTGGAIAQTGALNASEVKLVTGTGGIMVNGTIAATGAGDSIVLASAGNFVNNAGAAALDPGAGRWLVYSNDPAADTRGGLDYDFKQYNATYGVTPVLGSSNGFLYSIAPSVTASLIGTASRAYDGTTNALLNAGNYSLSGVIDGDTVNLNVATLGYDNKDVGLGKLVTASGLSISNATNGAASVHGYQLTSTTASANIGTIVAAPLTINADNVSRDQAQANPAFSASYTGFVTGETAGVLAGTLSFSTPAEMSSPPGPYPITPFGQTASNYAMTFVDGTLMVLPAGASSSPSLRLGDALIDAMSDVRSGIFQATVCPSPTWDGPKSTDTRGVSDSCKGATDETFFSSRAIRSNLAVEHAPYDAAAIPRQSALVRSGAAITSATAGETLWNPVVNNDGVIEANSLIERGGVIRLEASNAAAISKQ